MERSLLYVYLGFEQNYTFPRLVRLLPKKKGERG